MPLTDYALSAIGDTVDLDQLVLFGYSVLGKLARTSPGFC